MIGTCFGIFLLLYTYSHGIEPGCENCGCCINKECSTEYVDGREIDVYCTLGCIPGVGGNRCYNTCPSDCVTCEQRVPRNCTTCDERKYLDEDKRCIKCPKNCKHCTSVTQCQECYFPYYNDGSKQDCSLSCPINCFCEHLDVCSACQDGFYNVGNTCRNACPDTCKTCTDQSHCLSCIPPYSGDMCCIKDGNCRNCSSSTVCDKCTDGYFRIKCDISCPQTCHNLRCGRDKGICLDGCEDGFYGDYCKKNCNQGCLKSRCNRDHGYCVEGCEVGLHGDHCAQYCSERCLTGMCRQDNGSCINGCKPGFEGPTCSQKQKAPSSVLEIGTLAGIGISSLALIVTFVIVVTICVVRICRKTKSQSKNSDTTMCANYINLQLQTIPNDTVDVCVNIDQKDTNGIEPGCGNCGCCINKECSREYVQGVYVDQYCTHGCITGIGGRKCYNKCANDCLTCNRTHAQNCATCDYMKYVNDAKRCVDCPKNCKKCTSAAQCQECFSPYYNDGSKQDCSLSCPRNCLCEIRGVCSSCEDGFYNVGNTCKNACLDTCKTCFDQSHCQSCKPSYSGDICCVKNGHCLKCSSSTKCENCFDGYYGDQCGRTCPSNCKSLLCNRGNGNCLSCQDGYYGTKCEKSCAKACHQLQCERSTGICLRCDVSLYGNYCSHNCSKACLNNHCNMQNGQCSEGCIVGYTGANCTQVSVPRIGTEDTTSFPAVTGIGAVIGISVTLLVVIVTIVLVVTIIIVRRWKMNFLKKYRSPINEASYVNTELQLNSTEAIDVSANNGQIDQSEYERLDERYAKQHDEYDQIKSVNQQ